MTLNFTALLADNTKEKYIFYGKAELIFKGSVEIKDSTEFASLSWSCKSFHLSGSTEDELLRSEYDYNISAQQFFWSDRYSLSYKGLLRKFSASSMWTGSLFLKSSPQRRAPSPLMREMKHFTPLNFAGGFFKQPLLHHAPFSIKFTSSAWPTRWLLFFAGSTTVWLNGTPSFLNDCIIAAWET